MTTYMDIISIFILITSFALVASKKITSYIKAFRIQSALLAMALAVMGYFHFVESGRIDTLVLCALIIALKVVYFPKLLNKTYDRVEHKVEKDFFMNIPMLILLCSGIVIFVYFIISGIGSFGNEDVTMQVVNMVSVVLIGVFFMITRKKAIGQIVGFLVVENGIFGAVMFGAEGMPLIVDIGIFIDLITGILIMGLMVFKINDLFDSINTNKLRRLKG